MTAVDYDSIADPVPADATPEEEPATETPDGPICEGCGKPIIRKPGQRGRTPKWHAECRPRTKTSVRTPKRSQKAGVNYAEGIAGIFQMASVGLLVAAGDHNKPLLADSKAVAEHGGNIAVALDALANEKPEVAAVLDKILAVGPYGVVIGAVVPLALQLASNHGVKLPSIPGPDEYLHMGMPNGN